MPLYSTVHCKGGGFFDFPRLNIYEKHISDFDTHNMDWMDTFVVSFIYFLIERCAKMGCVFKEIVRTVIVIL